MVSLLEMKNIHEDDMCTTCMFRANFTNTIVTKKSMHTDIEMCLWLIASLDTNFATISSENIY